MKVIVFAHRLEVGGTQVNAIELASALRDLHGFDVVLFATPGPMVELANQKGLRFLPAPDARLHPAPARMRALRDVVRSERPDLIHVWDWWQCLEAYYAVHLLMRVPMVVTNMTMSVTRLLPKALPTTYGTPELVDLARAAGSRCVDLIVPPVDVYYNAPGAIDARPFAKLCGMDDQAIKLVTVSRLCHAMKADSLFRTVDAVRTLSHDLPLQFVIVGDGEARSALERLAKQINAEFGRPAVVLAGALLDPRAAYAAADIVIGMGGSALRGMAFGKPVIVVGEQGFSAPLTPETAESFYYKGIFGVGSGDNEYLTADIRWLVENCDQLPALGEFSRQFVVQHFSLETVAARLAEFCQAAVTEVPEFRVVAKDGLRTVAVYLRERRFLVQSKDRSSREHGKLK